MPSPELGGGHAAARVHHASRRCGGGVAACGARAAAERMRRIGVLDGLCRGRSGSDRRVSRRFRQGLDEAGYGRRPQCSHRISLAQAVPNIDMRLLATELVAAATGRNPVPMRHRLPSRCSVRPDAIPIVFRQCLRSGRLGLRRQSCRDRAAISPACCMYEAGIDWQMAG